MPKLIVVTREGEERELMGEAGLSVMEVIRENNLPVEAACGGCCACATCHVYVREDWLPRLENAALALPNDPAIAAEVMAQLEADVDMKRTHLALYLCCKESLRVHKARQARNKRIGQFVRGLGHALLVRPMLGLRTRLRHGGDGENRGCADRSVQCTARVRPEHRPEKYRNHFKLPHFEIRIGDKTRASVLTRRQAPVEICSQRIGSPK